MTNGIWGYVPHLVPLLTGIMVGTFTYWVIRFILSLPSPQQTYKVRLPLTFKLFLPLARKLAPNFHQKESFKDVLDHLDQRLTMAGLIQEFSPEVFLALRIVIGIAMSIFSLFFMFSSVKIIFLLGVVIFGFGWFYPGIWLSGQIKERHRLIQRALPNVLDLLTLSVEAGRDFLTALRDILRNRPIDPLGEELEQVFREVQLGKQRRVALQAMAERVRQPDLESVVETLVQADQLGVSIGYILRVLGDQMRQKRFAYAEKKANESPVKLLFPLFIFIFPAVMIVILGPIFFKAFQSGSLF